VVADWRTGAYTIRDLASKYRVSTGFIHKHTRDIPRDLAETVNKIVESKQALASVDAQTVNAVNDVVHDKIRHIEFFTKAAMRNVSMAVRKLDADSTQYDHRLAAETIQKGRETVLGKTPDTAIQINTGDARPVQESPEQRANAIRTARQLLG
jgi:uncharacterized protein YlzI (FlbEa/FlbD family)